MADVNANIGINIDTSQSLAEIKALQRQLAQLYTSINKGSAAAAAAQKGLATNLMNTINAGGKFYAQMGTIRTSTESFTHALEKNKLTMREYFRYAAGSTTTFGRLFKQEFDTIGKVAEERVKKMQTQYIKLGRDASGAMKAIAVTPTTLNMKDYGTQVAIAAQKQALLNQLLKQGSTNLLNFGKNTQWAGRQLMVGFTIPLSYFGTAAAKTFMDLEAQAIKFKRVYGDMFTTTAETNKALSDVQNLAKEFTKYGVAVSKTMEMAASAAAMGKTGAELTAQVAQATRLAVLGNVEQQQALDTTISLTNAFGIAAEDLTSKINFLNAVENQTVTSIEDLTIAVPKAGPVIQQLGGSVEDLAFFLTAMREGGINASEGANALKSGLASLINPTKKAREMLAGMGIDINAIVQGNAGNLRETVIDFAQALDTLAPLERARAIEQLFGKFQFARLSTLFQNVSKDGTQAARVLGLAGKSVEELAILSERELKTVEDAVGTNFRAAVEQLKLSIAPIGKEFLKVITPVIKFFGDLFEKFNNLSDGSKKFIVVLTTLIGLVGPTLLMTFGLLANGAANIIKLFVLMRQGFLKLTGNSTNLAQQTQYLNSEQMEAAVVAASLNQAHTKLTQQFTLETAAVTQLRNAYVQATIAAAKFAAAHPGMMLPGFKGAKGIKLAGGTTEVVGGQPGKDSVPSLLMPGEAVIPTAIAQDDRFKPLVQALVSGEIQQYGDGTDEVTKVRQKAIKRRFRKLYGSDVNTRQSYMRNASNLDKLVDRLTYDQTTKTYTLTTKDGKVFTGITESKLFDKANYVFGKTPSQKGDFISETKFGTPANLERQLVRSSKEGRLGTGAPTKLLALRDKANIQFAGKGIDKEVASITEKLQRAGYNPKQIKDFTQSHLSHIVGGGDTATKWTRGQVLSDFQGLNQYIKGAGGPDTLKLIKDPRVMLPVSQGGMGMSPRQVQMLLRDWAWAGNQKHPTSDTEFRRYARIAAFQEAADKAGMKVKNISLVKGINALASVRDPQFYKDVHQRIIQLGEKASIGVAKGQVEKLTKDIMRGAVLKGRAEFAVLANAKEKIQNTITGTQRPVTGTKVDTSQITTTTGNKKDNILTTLKRGERIIRTVAGARTGGKLILPGAQDAPIQLSQSQMRAAKEGISNKEAKRRIAAETKAAIAAEKQAAITEKTTAATKTLGQKFTTGANVFSGLTILGSFMGGKIGEVSKTLAPFVIGIATIAQLLPGLKSGLLKLGTFLLANPYIAVAAVLASLVVAYKVLDAKTKQQAAEQSKYIDAVSATTEKMKRIGEITGKVGASEIMSRRRQGAQTNTFSDNLTRVGQQFGTTFLESDVGKEMLTNFQNSLAKGGSNAVKQIALELSSYISDGIMTAEQANSVARSIGISLSDMSLFVGIQGELNSIIGPNGERLEKEPLKVRLQIIQETAGTQQDYLKAIEEQYSSENKNQRDSDKLRQNIAASAAAVASQTLETIRSQRDAQAKMYEDQIRALETQKKSTSDKEKQLKIQEQIDGLQKQSIVDDKQLGEQRKKSIETVLKTYEKIAAENKLNFGPSKEEKALFASAQQQVKLKYADDPFTQTVLDTLSGLKGKGSEQLELTLLANLGAGDMTPMQVDSLLKLYDSNIDAITTVLNTKIALENPDKFAELQNLVGNIKGKNAKKIGIDLIAKMTAEGGEANFDKRLAALNLLATFDGKEIDLAAYIETKGMEGIDALAEDLDALEKMPDVTQKTVETTLKEIGMSGAGIQGVTDNWEYFSKLPDTVRKQAIQVYTALYETLFKDEASRLAFYAKYKTGGDRTAAGHLAQLEGGKRDVEYTLDATRTIIGEGKEKNTIPGGDGSGSGGGGAGRDTTLDNLLTRLKFIRKASIDAEKGVGELMRITSGKGITGFGGVMQQLMAGPKGGFNREFISFLEQMDNKTRATYMTVKNGEVILTKQGKALKEAFNEKVIGEYQVVQAQTIQDTLAQNAALKKLAAAGVDSGTALEMVADANLAVAINGKTIDSAKLRKMAKDAQDAKDRVKELNFEVLQLAENLKKDVIAAGETVEALAAARAAGIVDPEMLKFISENKTVVDEILKSNMSSETIKGIVASKSALKELGDVTEGLINPAEKAMQSFLKLKDAAFKVFDQQTRDAQGEFDKFMGSVASDVIKTLPKEFQGLSFTDAIDKANADIDTLRASIQDIEYTKIRPLDIQIEASENSIQKFRDQLGTAASKLKLKDGSLLPDAAYDDVKQKLEDKISAAELDLEFNPKYGARFVEGLQDQISQLDLNIELNFTRPIADLQEQSSDLANDLTLMDHVAQQINEKYDMQAEALKRVSDINQEILNQQKSQLDIAGAITQGDIAAAARAAQEARAQAASAASQRATGVLDAARQAEIGALRSAGGMTRAQIEERQFQIGQQIYNLEEQSEIKQRQIRDIQDQIRAIEEIRTQKQREIRAIQDEIAAGEKAREQFVRENILPLENQIKNLQSERQKFVNDIKNKEAEIARIQNEVLIPLEAEVKKREKILNDRLKAIEAEKTAWEQAQTALEKATTKAGEFATNAEAARKAFEDAKKIYDDFGDGKTITVTVNKIINEIIGTVVKTPSSTAGTRTVPRGAILPEMYGGKIKPMAYGGRIGSDSVPAMLTPGEFVVNKAATDSFLPLLSLLNNTKYPSMLANRLGSFIQPPAYPSTSAKDLTAPIFYTPRNTIVNSAPMSSSYSSANIDNSSMVYNYNIGITVGGTNSNPNNIAQAVIDEIKYIDSQRLRTQRAV